MFKVELTQIALFDEQIDKATVSKIDWRGGAVIRFLASFIDSYQGRVFILLLFRESFFLCADFLPTIIGISSDDPHEIQPVEIFFLHKHTSFIISCPQTVHHLSSRQRLQI